MEPRPRCKGCCRAVAGPDPVPKSSGTRASSVFPLKCGPSAGLWRVNKVSVTQRGALTPGSLRPQKRGGKCVFVFYFFLLNVFLHSPADCAAFDSYRTLVRPSFKVAYKLATALEWRCCPGFAGEECRKGEPRVTPPRHTARAAVDMSVYCPRPVPLQQFQPHLGGYF